MRVLRAKRKRTESDDHRTFTKEEVADAAWQPWLLPKEVSQRIIRLIPPGYRKRFRFYFEDFGCMSCRRKDVVYRTLGFCEICHSKITERMRLSMRRHRKKLGVTKASPRVRWYIDHVNQAEKLLADFLPQKHKSRSI